MFKSNINIAEVKLDFQLSYQVYNYLQTVWSYFIITQKPLKL